MSTPYALHDAQLRTQRVLRVLIVVTAALLVATVALLVVQLTRDELPTHCHPTVEITTTDLEQCRL